MPNASGLQLLPLPSDPTQCNLLSSDTTCSHSISMAAAPWKISQTQLTTSTRPIFTHGVAPSTYWTQQIRAQSVHQNGSHDHIQVYTWATHLAMQDLLHLSSTSKPVTSAPSSTSSLTTSFLLSRISAMMNPHQTGSNYSIIPPRRPPRIKLNFPTTGSILQLPPHLLHYKLVSLSIQSRMM